MEPLSLGFSSLGVTYNTMVDAIIRPPRMHYDISDLGPSPFRLARRSFQRIDFQVVNKRGLTIQASHYEPVPSERPRKQLPCVIYLHGNCGCRLDALECLSILLPYNITLVSFDFTGSGASDGEYVSLGYYEKEDVTSVVEYLRTLGTVSRIGLWGRSMGAATAIMFAVSNPSIACLVLDSPFSSLTKVAKELVENSPVKIPKMMVSIGLRMIRKTILSKAKFDINKLEPLSAVGNCFMPALFAHGESDTFIGPHHSHELYEKYAGDKNQLLVEGDHNSPRPRFFFDSASIFFHNALLSSEEQEESVQTNESLESADVDPGFSRTMRIGDLSHYDPSVDDLEDEMLRHALMLSLQDCSSPSEDEQCPGEKQQEEAEQKRKSLTVPDSRGS